MTDLQYEAPSTLEDAVALLAGAGDSAKILAGGTDVLVQMHLDMIEPELIVDIKNIEELRTIAKVDGGYRFGAAVSGVELMDHADFCQTWPGVMDGIKLIGSLQVRGRASVGGNVCNASPAADSVPAMIAAGATATIIGSNGTREVAVEDIGIAPGKTCLDKGEFVVSFFLPKRAPNSGGAYQRFTPRTEMDIAVVGVGIDITLDGKGVCTHARVSLGAVAERVLLVEEAANALIGTKVDEAAIANLSAAASAACRPIDDKRGTKEYRIKVAGVLAGRVAAIALERAQKGGKK